MDIQEEIKKVKQQQSSVKKAKVYLKDLEIRISWAEKKISKLEFALEVHFKELEKLQKLKVRKLFTTILVDKETQLEEKRQDYLEKFLEFKEAKKSLDFLLYEKQIVIDKINAGKNLEDKLKALLDKREEQFILQNPKSATGIIEIQIEIDKCNLLKREFYEALIEGARSKKHIAIITNNLSQAKTLRNFTFINENQKEYRDEKQHVDKAMEAFYILKPILRKFELELEDIYKNHGYLLSVSLDSLNVFSKKYYDYLINDWIIYEKINVASKAMKELEGNILYLISKLEKEQKKNLLLIKGLEERKQASLDKLS